MKHASPALHIIIIICVSFFAFFINNHTVPADLMESRNLATAQEMVRTGNYLIPTMNGELRLEKPPLPTWVAAGIENIIPDNLVAQRCAAGFMATLMAIFLYLLVRRLTSNGMVALIAALVMSSCFNVVMAGRTATWDIYCHSFMLGAIYFIVRGFSSEGRRWGDFAFAGIFMGLSFLGKGPVSFYALLLPFVISYAAVMRPKGKGKALPVVIMLLLCVVVAFWWPAYISLFHREAGMAAVDQESGAWMNHNVRPFWYYWQFPAEAGIWALFWITSIFYFFWKRPSKHRLIFRFSMVWTLTALVLLSLIPEKKTRYLLPMLIPGAINIAFYIWYSIQSMRSRGERRVFRFNATLIGIIALGIPVLVYMLPEPAFSIKFAVTAVLCLGVTIYILGSTYSHHGIRPLGVFWGTLGLMVIFEIFGLTAVGSMFINDQRHSIRLLRDNPAITNMEVFHDKEEELRMELVYEANCLIRPMDLQSDSTVYANLPFVLISTKPISEQMEGKNVEIEYIDTFDNNWRKPDSKSHNKKLVKEAAIIREAKVTLSEQSRGELTEN